MYSGQLKQRVVTPEIIQELVLDLESGVVDAGHHPSLEQVVASAQVTLRYTFSPLFNIITRLFV